MYKRILTTLFAVSLAMLMTGCYTRSIVNFGNGTDTAVKVRSSQTTEEIEVKPGAFKNLPHAVGDLTVRISSDGQFKFFDVEPPALDVTGGGYLSKRTYFCGPGEITLRVKLETNMQLYTLMPSKRGVDPSVKQPEGYPKVGQKVSE